MPIPQDRLIEMVGYADAMLESIDQLQERTNKAVDVAMLVANANSVLAHNAPEDPANKVLRDTIEGLLTLRAYIVTLGVPLEIRKQIMKEKIHFEQTRNKNERMANYRRAKANAKQDAKIGAKVGVDTNVSEDTPKLATIPSAAPVTREERRANAMKPMAQRMAESAEKAAREAKEIAEAQELITQEAKDVLVALEETPKVASKAAPALAPELSDRPKMRKITVDGQEIMTSAPSMEELSKPAFEEGKSIF